MSGRSATFESAWERPAPPLPLDRPALVTLLTRAGLGSPGAAAHLAEGLANTSWRVARDRGGDVVVRVATRPRAEVLRELAARALAPVPTAAPLLVAWDVEWDGRGAQVVVSPWVEGPTLGLLLATADARLAAAAGRAQGRALAAMQAVAFDAVGLLDEEARLAASEGPFSACWRRWLDGWLAGRAGARLGPALARELRAWAERVTSELAALDGRAHLSHADWKPKNLVVDPDTGALRAVLDWEFAWSGPPLYDLGLLLRHRDAVDPGFAPAVIDGLREAGAGLPGDPLRVAALLDATNLVFLADREASGPGVLADVSRRLAALVRTT